MKQENKKTGPLTKREMAALTMGVPCSGDDELDRIILAGTRLRIATQMMEARIAQHDPLTAIGPVSAKRHAKDAITATDGLLAEFAAEPTDG